MRIKQIPPGAQYGHLTVIEELDQRSQYGDRMYLCSCECGTTVTRAARLLTPKTRYCSTACAMRSFNLPEGASKARAAKTDIYDPRTERFKPLPDTPFDPAWIGWTLGHVTVLRYCGFFAPSSRSAFAASVAATDAPVKEKRMSIDASGHTFLACCDCGTVFYATYSALRRGVGYCGSDCTLRVTQGEYIVVDKELGLVVRSTDELRGLHAQLRAVNTQRTILYRQIKLAERRELARTRAEIRDNPSPDTPSPATQSVATLPALPFKDTRPRDKNGVVIKDMHEYEWARLTLRNRLCKPLEDRNGSLNDVHSIEDMNRVLHNRYKPTRQEYFNALMAGGYFIEYPEELSAWNDVNNT